MSRYNRLNMVPDVVPEGDGFLASSTQLPNAFGEGETPEEAIENFWGIVELLTELAAVPDWPHERAPWLDEWESGRGEEGEFSDASWMEGNDPGEGGAAN